MGSGDGGVEGTMSLDLALAFKNIGFDDVSHGVSIAAVQRLEDHLLTAPQADIRTTHTFYPGKYERKITIPPWTVLTGAAHKTAYRVRAERGSIAVNTDDGIKIIVAPMEFDVPAGIKRVGRVFEEECVWVDIYDNPDDCTDIPTLEERLYVVPEGGLGETRAANRIAADQADYQKFLQQMGMTQDEMDAIVKAEADIIPMPPGADVEVRPSRIHGVGVFALRAFGQNEVICPGRLDGHRTPAGRFINHSVSPNTTSVKCGADIYAVALRDIETGEEILVNYRASVKINFGIEIEGEQKCLVG